MTDAINYGMTIKTEMLPVVVRTITVPDESPIPNVRVYSFVQANDGTVLTGHLAHGWSRYIADCLNQGPFARQISGKGKLLNKIIIPGLPIDHWEGRTIAQAEDGSYRIEETRDFTRQMQRVKRYMSKRYVKMSIGGDVQMQCVFVLPYGCKLQLPNLIATAEKVLFATGVLSSKRYNRVKSVDGSEIIYTNNEDEVSTQIYLRAVE